MEASEGKLSEKWKSGPGPHLSESIASTTGNMASDGASSVTSSASQAASIIPLSNVEAQRAILSTEEKVTVHEQLEGLEKKLSLDGKRAGTPCIKMPLHLYAERWRCPIAGNPTIAY